MSRYMLYVLLLLGLFNTHAMAQTCIPDSDIPFVCGTINPEDLYQVPETPWVIASGRVSDVAGPIYAVATRDHRARVLFPANAAPPDQHHELSTSWAHAARGHCERAYPVRRGPWGTRSD